MLPSVIVPLTLNLMVSMPVAVPTAQSPPVVSVPKLLALLIASRRVQNPLPEVLTGSVVLVTVMTPDPGADPVAPICLDSNAPMSQAMPSLSSASGRG